MTAYDCASQHDSAQADAPLFEVSELGRAASVFNLSDLRSEHRRWALVMADDHAILRRLFRRLEDAQSPDVQTRLLRLALDFEAMHGEFEAGWIQVPQLERLTAVVQDLALELEGMAPRTALYRSRGLAWMALMRDLMAREERFHHDGLPWTRPNQPWSNELLNRRSHLMRSANLELRQSSFTKSAA